jgi:hypothetical protein
MKINKLPKQEDVIKVELAAHQVSAVKVTAANKEHLIEAVFSAYLGEKCKYCGKKYKTMEDLKDTVWAGEHEYGRLACKACWAENNKSGGTIKKHAVDSIPI